MRHFGSGVALLAASVCLAQEAPVILAPADHAVLTGVARIIVKGGKVQVTIDGKPAAVSSPAPGVWMGEAKLAPGLHEFIARDESGETKVAVFSGKAYTGWKVFKSHPPAGGCDTCHAVKDGQWSMKRASIAGVCSACHPQDRFPVVHTHNTDLLSECQGCHLPHGAVTARLLKVPKTTACRQCHNQP